MKKLLTLAIVVAIAYFGYQKFLGFAFSDKGLARIVESANKEFPKDIANGVRMEKLEAEPGLRVISRVKLPVSKRDLDPARTPKFSDFACKDQVGRYMLDHGVTWVFVVQDKNGFAVHEEEVALSDCK